MRKTLTKIVITLALVLMFAFTFVSSTMAAELTDKEKIQMEINNINVPNRAIIDFPLTTKSAYGSQITWESNDTTTIAIVNNWAKVTRGEEDKTVTLTVTIVKNGETETKTFDVVVPKGTTLSNTYHIFYELNGGVNNENNPNTYKVGTQPSLLVPTKEGSEFDGWYLDQEFKGDAITSLPFGLSGDVRVYAKWADPVVTGIVVTTEPKTTYNAFENFDATGMVVEAVYSNGQNVVITDYTVDKQQLVASDTSVTVSYLTFQATINITVNKIDYDLTGVTFENGEKTYNGLEQSLEITGTLPQGLSVTYSAGQTNVGSNVITATFVNSDEINYNTPDAKEATITINPAKLTISANSISSKLGNEIPSFTASYEGFVNNETSSVLQGTLVFECSATSTSPVGNYDINVSGVTSSNYDIEFVKGTLSITTLTITIEVDDASMTKTYNGQNQMFTATVTSEGEPLPITLLYKLNGVEFTGAINKGTYQVMVEYNDATYGQGSLQVVFTINAKELEESMFTPIADQEYTGSAIEPAISGSFASKDFVLGEDYTVVYQNNVSQGVATAVVSGANNFSGTINLTFAIGEDTLVTVKNVKDYLTQNYTALPTTVVTTYLGATIDWVSSSTALSISSDGTVTYIALEEVQVVTLYGVITKNDAAEYFILEVEIPVKEEDNTTQAVLTNGRENDSGAALSADQLLEKFDNNYIASVTAIDKIYEGKEDALKTGTANDPGYFTLAMKLGYKAIQVVIEAKAYNAGGGSITINNQTFDLTTDTATYTFTFDATTLIEVTTTKRTYISGITIYFEESSQEVTTLATPETTLVEGVISWEAIPNATGYAILTDEGELARVGKDDTSYTLSIAAQATDKIYNIYVKALGDNSGFLDSELSIALEHEVKAGIVSSAYTLVTDVTSLKAGDKIIIAAAGFDFALSTTQKGNNRGKTEITKTDNQLTFLDDAGVQVITLEAGTKDGTFAFNVGDGYLYAASSSKNYLRTQATNNDNGSWLITISADGVASIVAQGTYTRNNLKYNNGSNLFSCYASGQQDVVIYKLAESN